MAFARMTHEQRAKLMQGKRLGGGHPLRACAVAQPAACLSKIQRKVLGFVDHTQPLIEAVRVSALHAGNKPQLPALFAPCLGHQPMKELRAITLRSRGARGHEVFNFHVLARVQPFRSSASRHGLHIAVGKVGELEAGASRQTLNRRSEVVQREVRTKLGEDGVACHDLLMRDGEFDQGGHGGKPGLSVSQSFRAGTGADGATVDWRAGALSGALSRRNGMQGVAHGPQQADSIVADAKLSAIELRFDRMRDRAATRLSIIDFFSLR